MSKIGKKPITLPSGVTVAVEGGQISVKGPKGTLVRAIPAGISIAIADNTVVVSPASAHPSGEERAQWGLWRALVSNLVIGVTTGWATTLEFQGVGYKAIVKGKDLELSLGYSHTITVPAPEGVTFTTDKTTITVSGTDKESVGQTAAVIRAKRLPEPYKGSGIRYSDEIIKKKAGKKAATAA